MENTTVKERLLTYLKSKRISQLEFTRTIDVSPTYIGAMRKGIPTSKLQRIEKHYPDLNRDWLLYGEGEMIKKNDTTDCDLSLMKEYETLLLPVEAFAGGLQMWSEGVKEADCRKIYAPISGVDFAIPIRGDSMEPKFHDGSILLIKRINEKAFIPWGHPMVIDTENGVLVKNVFPMKKEMADFGEEYIEVESVNPKYPPFKIPTSSIYGLYRVMGTLDVFSVM